MADICYFCECGGPLVKLTASRSDTAEVLDTVCICPECLNGSEDLRELFSIGVISVEPDSGVAYLAGRPPYEGP
jgi:hypothetical protein